MESSLEEVAFYTKTIEDSFKLLGSSYQGLSTAQAQSLAEQYGRNEIPQGKRMTFLEKLVNELNYALIYVLIAGAIISFAFDHIADAVVIICVIIINVIVSVYMERRAESTNEKLRAMMSPSALALRDGQRSILPSAELIPGDIVYLQAGDIVPADGRVIVAYDLYVQEAALTGESYAINKSTTPIASLVSTQLPIAERTCMVFSGTQVLKGSGQVLITAIGKNSEIGKINYLLLQMGWQKTPLQLQLQVFGHVLSVIIVVLAAFALGVALGRKHSVKDSFAYAVAVAVAAVPESLPSVVTITFAIGVRLMARKGAIIKALPAVETLGSVSVICSDKTGTLTQNVLTLKTIGTKHGLIELSDEGRILSTSNHGSAKAPDRPIVEADIFRFILPGLLCNDAVIRFGDESNKSGRKSQFNGQPAPLPISPDQFAIQGEPTETCIMTLATKVISLTTNDPTMSARIVSDTCRHYRRLAEIPFDSTSKYMASLHELTKEDCKRWLGASSATLADSTKVIFLKGAPERLISLTSDRHSFWLGNADALAARGMRVLGLAYRILPSSAPSFATNSLTDDDIFTDRGGDYKMVSLLGILDPPRPEAITAVRHAQKAGITVKMITGDHPATALTIAKQVGIQMNPGFAPTADDADMKLKAITGLELDEEWETSIDAFDTMVMSNHIFARTSPEHKLKIVQSLQRQHIICSMTGDGVNDAPALKAANVGVAMGIAGSGVAKEAAEMVITNDNFATIVDAVRIGRCTHQNLVKVLNFVLPTNGGQAFSIIFALIIGVDVPITALQILWVNMITSISLGMVLAFENPHPEIMAAKPRRSNKPVFGRFLAWRLAFVIVVLVFCVLGHYEWERRHHTEYSVKKLRTIAVNTLSVCQAAYLFSCRNLRHFQSPIVTFTENPRYIWLGIVSIAVFQVIFTYAPPFQYIFRTEAISGSSWGRCLLFGFMTFVAVELEKFVSSYTIPWRRDMYRRLFQTESTSEGNPAVELSKSTSSSTYVTVAGHDHQMDDNAV